MNFVPGGLFGLVGGSLTNAAIAIAGLTPDEVLAYDYDKIAQRRQKQLDDMKSTRKADPKHTLTLADIHDELTEDKNKNKGSQKPNSANENKVSSEAGASVSVQQSVPAPSVTNTLEDAKR
jgi:hypothetical protein